MEKAAKERAVCRFAEKDGGASITYSDIARETGCGKRQPIRLSVRLRDEGAAAEGGDGSLAQLASRCATSAYMRYFAGLCESNEKLWSFCTFKRKDK